MNTGPKGIALIKRFEGLAKLMPDGSVHAYPDPGTGGKPYTIGFGATGPDIGPNTVWTQAQCETRLKFDLSRFERDVEHLAPHTSQDQFDALVSFTFNCGTANLKSSTLLRKHNAGDYAGAAAEFGKWTRAAGRVLPGLVRRRAAEAALYRGEAA